MERIAASIKEFGKVREASIFEEACATFIKIAQQTYTSAERYGAFLEKTMSCRTTS